MQDNNDPDSPQQQQADTDAAASSAQDTFKREAQSAKEALHDARDEVARKAGEYASEAKAAAVEQAEVAQQDASASLAAFGGALRAAGDHLAGSDQRAAAQFMQQAASGIERFANSLRNKPFADVIGDVRTFGRENSGALIAGSLLAGLALGRFVKSSMPASGTARQPQQSGSGGEPWTADEFGQVPGSGQQMQQSTDQAQQASSTYSGTATRSSGYE
jgi:hypothetical protein